MAPMGIRGGGQKDYCIAEPTREKVWLTFPPRNVRIRITTMAISTRISAYSTRPCPRFFNCSSFLRMFAVTSLYDYGWARSSCSPKGKGAAGGAICTGEPPCQGSNALVKRLPEHEIRVNERRMNCKRSEARQGEHSKRSGIVC